MAKASDQADAQDSSPPLVLGTAGHIDHGKTALVRALTGRDLDQLPEEKTRGITIELGFAPLELPGGLRLGLVDVPGHERFVRTMVAGASGLDLVMLVVAADEGVMPQTREHLAICELLGIDRGLAVLTKADLVDDEMIELATEEIRDVLADGLLSDIPIIPASSLTGDGIERIREELAALIAEAPPRLDDRRPPRLFIDRVFTKHGFGAVVTGTWSGGSLAVGDTVVLEPGARKAKIRGLERHGDSIERATAGARIAVNLQGIAIEDISRGDLLTAPDSILECASFDARVEWRARATELDESTSVELLVGTTERRARMARIGSRTIEPGETGFARVHLDGPPLPLLPGDRFVARGFAREAGIGATLGGGVILDIAPPRKRRGDPTLLADLERLASDDRSDTLEVRIARAGLEGLSDARLRLETGLDPAELDHLLGTLAEHDRILRFDAGICLGQEAGANLCERLLTGLRDFHARDPLLPGMSRAACAGMLPENVPTGVRTALIARLAEAGEVTIEGEIVARSDWRPRLDADQTALAEKIGGALAQAGFEPPALAILAEELGAAETTVRALAHYLDRAGRLVAAPEGFFFDRASVEGLIERVVQHFESSDELDTQTFKAMIGASRRTAMPLMALLDDLQITRRDGSIRRLLSATPRR